MGGQLTAMVFLCGGDRSGLDNLRFPSLLSPLDITWAGILAFGRCPKQVRALDTRS